MARSALVAQFWFRKESTGSSRRRGGGCCTKPCGCCSCKQRWMDLFRAKAAREMSGYDTRAAATPQQSVSKYYCNLVIVIPRKIIHFDSI